MMYDIFNAYWDFLNKFSPYLLFGFIEADFKSTDKAIKKFEALNFPPLLSNQIIGIVIKIMKTNLNVMLLTITQ